MITMTVGFGLCPVSVSSTGEQQKVSLMIDLLGKWSFSDFHTCFLLHLFSFLSLLLVYHSFFYQFFPFNAFLSISDTCLSGGEVAGIVIGCFVLLLIIVLLIIFLCCGRRRRRRRRRRGEFVWPLFISSYLHDALDSTHFLELDSYFIIGFCILQHQKCRRTTQTPGLQ